MTARQKFLSLGILVLIVLGIAFASISVSRIKPAAFQTSIFNLQNLKKVHRRHVARSLLAQAEVMRDSAPLPENTCVYLPPQNPEYKAEFLTAEVKIWAEQGAEYEAALYVKNTGTFSWFGDLSGCKNEKIMRLGTAHERDHSSALYNPADPRWISQTRIMMMENRVNPGEIATFRFSGKAPKTADIFREYFQPIVEGGAWLEEKEATARVDLYVGEVLPSFERALHYLAKSAQASSVDTAGELTIDVDISEQKMRVKLGETAVREYTVSTGTFRTPTPLGTFKILNKQELRIAAAWPHYRMPYWQGFTTRGHGLHSLPYLANDKGIFWEEALNHIGQRVSHGCIRILPEDAEDLYHLTEVETTLVIHE